MRGPMPILTASCTSGLPRGLPNSVSSTSATLAHMSALGLDRIPGDGLLGATLPALMRSEREVAGESGQLLFISSVANAVGYLAYVLLGHPLLSTQVLLGLLAGTCLFASLLANGFRPPRAQVVVATAGVALVAVMMVRWDERNFTLAHWAQQLTPRDEAFYFKSGSESATLVRSPNHEWITYNGHPSISVQRDGRVTAEEMISGVIPALGAPRLERALVLGLGTGITAGAASRIFETTDVVEINHAFYKMMPEIAYANLQIEDNPSARLHLADGRAFLIGRELSYDAILNSIPAPTYYSASKIYTIEFYERVRRALKPDGIFSTWLTVPDMSEEGLLTILSALHQFFPYCDLRLMSPAYYMATCSRQRLHPRRFSELSAEPILVEQLQNSLGELDLDEFFVDTRISENIFEHFTPEVPRANTDDHPVLETMLVRRYQMRRMGREIFLERQASLNVDPVRLHELGDPARLYRRAATFYHLDRNYFQRNFVPLLKRRGGMNEVLRLARQIRGPQDAEVQ